MSDWRGGDDQQRSPRKPVKKETPQPTTSHVEPKKPTVKTDWRGRPAVGPVAASTEREWSKHVQTGDADARKLRRILLVSGILLTLCVTTIAFVVVIWTRHPKTPFYWSIAKGSSQAVDVGETPFGQSLLDQRKTKIPTTNIDPAVGINLKQLSGTQRSAATKSKVSAYLISGFIVRLDDSSAHNWGLVESSGDPFASTANASSIVAVLQGIADQTPKNRHALVGFDVRPPTVVTNLGDLGFPTEAFEKAFESLTAEQQDKLILALPCQTGQENWTAPEFSSSVFAHFFVEGLVKGFKSSKKYGMGASDIKLSEFQDGLVNAVQTWVGLNRHAQQQPLIKMSAETATNLDLRLSGSPEIAANFQVSSPTELDRKLYDNLASLWSRLVGLRSMRSIEPFAHAQVESQLIHLEELAESSTDDSGTASDANAPLSNKFIKDVERSLSDLETKRDSIPRVSLIEAKLASQARNSTIVFGDNVNESIDVRLEDLLIRGSAKLPESNTNRDQQCWQVWRFLADPANELAKVSADLQSSIWKDRFSSSCLTRCLEYVRQPANHEWLEIQLLRILLKEVDWQSTLLEPLRIEAVARVIGTFDRLQSVACAAEPEICLWTKEEVQKLDSVFLQAFDLLVANDYQGCVSLLKGIEADLGELGNKVHRLGSAISLRDSVVHVAPHLLAAWVREQRYGDSRKMDLMKPDELAGLVKLGMDVTDLLSVPQRGTLDPRFSSAEIADSRARLDALTQSAFVKLSEQSDNDPEVLRDSRIALRWPFLEPSLRRTLHSRVMQLQKEVDSPGTLPASISFAELQTELHQKFSKFPEIAKDYAQIYQGDPRLALQSLQAEIDRNMRSASSPADASVLYKSSRKFQILANSLGQRGYATAIDGMQWPWSSLLAFRRYCETQYVALQVSRLCQAAWGNGEIQSSSTAFYFEQLVGQYRVDVEPLKRVPGFESFAVGFDMRSLVANPRGNLLNTQIKSIAPVAVGIASSGSGEFLAKEVQVVSPFLKSGSVLALKLGEQRLVPFFDGPTAISLREPSPQVMRIAKAAQREKVRIAFRGHSLAKEMPVEEAPQEYSIVFNRHATKAPSITVSNATEVTSTVSILLDCSYSMIQPATKGGKVRVHDRIKQAVVELLNRIEKLSEENDNVIEVRLLLFGKVWDEDPDTRPEQFQPWPESNQICYTGELKCDQVRDILASNWIRPSAKTPLYDAISAAIDLTPNGLNRVVVVSDGANDVVDGNREELNYKGPRIDSEVLKSKILGTQNCSVYIFQYENLDFYSDADLRAAAEKSINSLKVLSQELQQSSKFSFGLHQDSSELTRELLASFPSSQVKISPFKDNKETWTGPFKKPVTVSSKLPTPFEVNVEAKSVEGVSAKPIPAWISGNEQLKMIFSLGTLRYQAFEDELQDYGFVFPYPLDHRQGTSEIQVHARTIFSADNNDLAIELAMHHKNDRTEFTRRPEFAFLELRLPDSKRSFHFWDYNFESRHFPILSFPSIRLEATDRRFELDCWVCFANPAELGLTNENLVPAGPLGDSHSVVVMTPMGERKFVVARNVTASKRIYSKSSEGVRETHQFKLERNARAYLIPFSKLNEWSENGKVERYTLPSQFLPN